ncbi:hypothetical protein C8Q73DRAFT_161039 [Cubamyces lactineus]|nr:hypothetical protein C8Q73DRAFT_161039 [Cubamyces lactineus]
MSLQSSSWQWGNGQKGTPLPSFTLRPATWSPIRKANDTHTLSDDPASSQSQHVPIPLTHAQPARMCEQNAHPPASEDISPTDGPRPHLPTTFSGHNSKCSGNEAVAPMRLPTVGELQQALDIVAPLADAEEQTREQVHEIRTLLISIGQRTAMLKKKGRRLQQLRLALERHLPELEGAHPSQAGRQASGVEENAGAGVDDEEELLEVEMALRGANFSDIPSAPKEGAEQKRYALGSMSS